MKSLVVLVLVLVLVVLLVPASAQEAAEGPPSDVMKVAELLFDEAGDLADAGKHKEAYEKLQAVLELVPDWDAAQFNAGLCAFLSDQFDGAAAHFKKAKALDPDDWAAREKLVQTYQALGKTEERDAERTELFEKFQKTDDEEYKERNYYVREQFVLEGRRVFVLEYFVWKPANNVIFKAIVTPADEDGEYAAVAMESPDLTTQVSRELGHITEEERVYSLDGYNIEGVYHKTYALMYKALTYEEFRARVMDILTGKVEAVSQTMIKKGDGEEAEVTVEVGEDDDDDDDDGGGDE